MPTLATDYCGVGLTSPIIVASANITAELDNIKACQDAGAGAVVMKSLFEEEVCRVAPTPRFALLRRGSGRERSFTLYSYEQASIWGPERYAREIARAKEKLSIPIIASINCITDEGWRAYARMMEEAGADLLELNVSCPHGSVTFRGQDVEDTIYQVLDVVQDTVRLPVTVKLSPQLTTPVNVVHEIDQRGAVGVVLFNRLTGLDIDVATMRPIMHGTYAGHGGPWSLHLTLRWLAAVRPATHMHISASGGVIDPDDAIKCLLAGADTVQICTAVILHGYPVIQSYNERLQEYLAQHDLHTVADLTGRALPHILATDQVDRRHCLQARIDPDVCTGCDRCRQVCTYFAIQAGDVYRVGAACDGCGLCGQLCPVGAITMVNVGGEG